MGLKEILFEKTQKELGIYLYMTKPDSNFSHAEQENQRQRFCSLYGLIEEAGLTDEYSDWKDSHPYTIKSD